MALHRRTATQGEKNIKNNQNTKSDNLSKQGKIRAPSVKENVKTNSKTNNKIDMSSLATKIDLNTLEINFTKEISKTKTELSNKISETHIILTKEISKISQELSDKMAEMHITLTKEISKSKITIILSIFLLIIGSIIANKFLS